MFCCGFGVWRWLLALILMGEGLGFAVGVFGLGLVHRVSGLTRD